MSLLSLLFTSDLFDPYFHPVCLVSAAQSNKSDRNLYLEGSYMQSDDGNEAGKQ